MAMTPVFAARAVSLFIIVLYIVIPIPVPTTAAAVIEIPGCFQGFWRVCAFRSSTIVKAMLAGAFMGNNLFHGLVLEFFHAGSGIGF